MSEMYCSNIDCSKEILKPYKLESLYSNIVS